jgi:predicted nucleic acid-binding protein
MGAGKHTSTVCARRDAPQLPQGAQPQRQREDRRRDGDRVLGQPSHRQPTRSILESLGLLVIRKSATSRRLDPAADRLLRLAALRRFIMIISPKLLFEIQATAGKAYLAEHLPGGEDLAVFLAQIWRVGTLDRPGAAAPADDRTDDLVVALAQWNGALLVTGDSWLLKLDAPPSIVTPREFLDMCEARS